MGKIKFWSRWAKTWLTVSRGTLRIGQSNPTAAERGQGLVEYALILVLVAVAVIAVLTFLGPAINEIFFDVMDCLPGSNFAEKALCNPGDPSIG